MPFPVKSSVPIKLFSPSRIGLFVCVSLVSACSMLAPEPAWKAAVAGDGPGDPYQINAAALVVENLPKSPRGNAPSYSVFGQPYKVMDSAVGFSESGEASWYGKKFHGRETSSGEIYDMHQLTAAHKHLPLPTFVRVTRQDNGQSIIVKVNDRGPFVDDRIIDLSYAAAARLGMLDSGKADVFIEAVSNHHSAPIVPDDVVASKNLPIESVSRESEPSNNDSREEVAPQAAEPRALIIAAQRQRFLQVGAFSQIPNAERMLASIRAFMDMPVGIDHDRARQLFRVRIGPLADEAMLHQARESLAMAGFENYTVVSAPY